MGEDCAARMPGTGSGGDVAVGEAVKLVGIPGAA
jgi:hypothetical protein